MEILRHRGIDTDQRVSIKRRDQNLLTDYMHFLFISELVVPWSLSWLCSLQLGADKQGSLPTEPGTEQGAGELQKQEGVSRLPLNLRGQNVTQSHAKELRKLMEQGYWIHGFCTSFLEHTLVDTLPEESAVTT